MDTLRKYHNRTSFTLYNFRISLKDAFCPYKFVTIVTHPLSAIKSPFTLNIINVKSHGSNRTEQRNLPWNSCRTEATTVRWINPPTKHAYAKRISFRKFHGNIAYIPSMLLEPPSTSSTKKPKNYKTKKKKTNRSSQKKKGNNRNRKDSKKKKERKKKERYITKFSCEPRQTSFDPVTMELLVERMIHPVCAIPLESRLSTWFLLLLLSPRPPRATAPSPSLYSSHIILRYVTLCT